jgi:hypothetical protein
MGDQPLSHWCTGQYIDVLHATPNVIIPKEKNHVFTFQPIPDSVFSHRFPQFVSQNFWGIPGSDRTLEKPMHNRHAVSKVVDTRTYSGIAV